MDIKKLAEAETFSASMTRMDRLELLANDQDEFNTSKNRPAEFRTKSLRDFLYLVFKRKIQILSFIAAVVLTVAISTILTPPIYKGNAQILVKVGRENLYVRDRDIMRPASEQQINSEIQILKSRSLAEKTLMTLKPAIVYPQPNAQDQGILGGFIQKISDTLRNVKKMARGIVKELFAKKRNRQILSPSINKELLAVLPKFQKDLEVKGIKNSNLINVSFKHEDPNISATVINTLAGIYLDHHLAVHKTSQTYNFFQEQTQLLKTKLQQSEDKFKLLKEQNNIISLKEERSLLLKGEAALLAELNRNLSQEIDTQNRIQLLQKQLSITPKRIRQGENITQNQDLISALETRLVELEIKENELKSKYTVLSNLPELKNVKNEIKVVRKKLEEYSIKQHRSKQSGENPTYRRLYEELLHYEAENKALKAKAVVQKTQLTEYQHKLERLNQVEIELDQIQQEIDVNRQNYRLYLKKFEESRISDAMDAVKFASVSLIEDARPPLKPINRKIKLNLLLAIVLGTFGGLSLALGLEYLSNSLEGVEDVEECLQLPVLASIPDLKA